LSGAGAPKHHAGRMKSAGGLRSENIMAEIKRTRRNTLERRCLGKSFKRLFVKSPKSIFKMLEKVKRA
jgi:biotin synthase-like enzyme